MATLKSKKTNIEETVVDAYQKIEDTVVGTYQKIEDAVVGTYQKIEDKFVEKFLDVEEEIIEIPEEGDETDKPGFFKQAFRDMKESAKMLREIDEVKNNQ